MLRNKQEYEAFTKVGTYVEKCPSVAGNVTKWTAEIILNNLQQEL